MVDFGALPPEVNSARMYTGPGSGPMMAAGAAWSALAAELHTTAATYSSATAELTDSWQGPSSAAMATASAPYIAWLNQTAAQAEQTASQSLAAAAAYEAAFAATVPPPVIEANRALLLSLAATNFLGQNTPAIAATEAIYTEMWAQDAAAMYGYAAASSAASQLTPFSEPPHTTNPAGQSAQGAAVAHAVGSSTASNASSTNPFSTFISAVANFDTLIGPLDPATRVPYAMFQWGNLLYAMKSDLEAHAGAAAASPAPRLVTTAPQLAGPPGPRGPVLASAGRAIPVGGLSAPNSWGAATPAGGSTAPASTTGTRFRALPSWAANAGESAMPGAGPMRGVTEPPMSKKVLRMRQNRFTMPRYSVGG